MSLEHAAMATADMQTPSGYPSGVFRRACRELNLTSYLEQALLVSDGETVIGEWGADPAFTALAAEHVLTTFDRSTPAAQLQYANLGDRDETFLIYARRVSEYMLTLVARSDQSIKNVRRITDALVQVVGASEVEPVVEEAELLAPCARINGQMDENAYAIAWRPLEPLPRAVRKIVRESARRLAQRKGCHLSFIGVATDHVHVVMQCPARRTGSWAAYVFKRGIEEDVARRYGVVASLWHRGFLAARSSEPIGSEALLAYLGHNS